MADLETSSWSETAASNNTATPNGWPEGMLPSDVNNCARENMAALKRDWNRSHPTITSGGTNTITLTYTTAPTAYVLGQTYSFIAGGNNSGATTLNVNGLGAKAVTKNGTTALAGGEILSGAIVTVKYDGTQFQLTDGVTSSLSTPVTVANGGTGLGTLTAHAVVLGEGTSNVALAAPSSAGQYFMDNGSGSDPSFQTPKGGSLLQWSPLDNEPPSSNFATLGFTNSHPMLQFDTTTQWAAVFTGIMPQRYSNATGITVYLNSTLASATSGTLGYVVSLERMDAATNVTSDSFAGTTTLTAATVPGTAGLPFLQSVAVTKGANMDSVVAGDTFRLKIARDVANDTAAGNSQLLSVEIRET